MVQRGTAEFERHVAATLEPTHRVSLARDYLTAAWDRASPPWSKCPRRRFFVCSSRRPVGWMPLRLGKPEVDLPQVKVPSVDACPANRGLRSNPSGENDNNEFTA